MSFSDISSAIILFAFVFIAHMVFHLFSVQNNIPFAKFSFGYGEIQGFQMPFTCFKLTSTLELSRNWKWSLAVSAWVIVAVAEVEGLAHSILSASAKNLLWQLPIFIPFQKEKNYLSYEPVIHFNLELAVSHFPEKTGKFYFVKFNLNRYIQKESFLDDSAVEPLKGSS